MDNPKSEDFSAIGLNSGVVEEPTRVSDEKKEIEEKVVTEEDMKKEEDKKR